MAILAPPHKGMQALPAEEVANEGARPQEDKLRDRYLEGKGG